MCEKKLKRTRQAFTPEEDEELRRLVGIYGEKKWEVISKHMEKRNPKQCCERWLNYLMPSIVNASWTPEEDEKLIWFVNYFGTKWSLLKKMFNGRSAINLRNRWTVLCHMNKSINERNIQFNMINNYTLNNNNYNNFKTINNNIETNRVNADFPTSQNSALIQPEPKKTIEESNTNYCSQVVDDLSLEFEDFLRDTEGFDLEVGENDYI